MKWEILKGSEKDFEGMTDGILSILENDLGDRYPFHLSMIAPIGRWFSVAERRPITEPESVLPASGSEMELDCGVEFYTNDGSYCFEEGTRVIVGGTVNFGLGDFLCVKVKGTNVITDVNPVFLRPIRSAEDVARWAFIDAIVSFDLNRKTLSIDELYRDLYDAIAAGMIPGVKLE